MNGARAPQVPLTIKIVIITRDGRVLHRHRRFWTCTKRAPG
jgi:hypothetical protein